MHLPDDHRNEHNKKRREAYRRKKVDAANKENKTIAEVEHFPLL